MNLNIREVIPEGKKLIADDDDTVMIDTCTANEDETYDFGGKKESNSPMSSDNDGKEELRDKIPPEPPTEVIETYFGP